MCCWGETDVNQNCQPAPPQGTLRRGGYCLSRQKQREKYSSQETKRTLRCARGKGKIYRVPFFHKCLSFLTKTGDYPVYGKNKLTKRCKCYRIGLLLNFRIVLHIWYKNSLYIRKEWAKKTANIVCCPIRCSVFKGEERV